jgi:hypothetical protein
MAETQIAYRYGGPLSGVTLDDGTELILHPGAEMKLTAGNAYVKALVAQGFLTEVEGGQEAAPAEAPVKRGRTAEPAREETKQPEVEEATNAS